MGRDHDEVNVVGHQAVSPDLGPAPPRRRADQIQIGPVVVITEEDLFAAVAPLGDVVSQVRNDDTGQAGHAPTSSVAMLNSRGSFIQCHRNPDTSTIPPCRPIPFNSLRRRKRLLALRAKMPDVVVPVAYGLDVLGAGQNSLVFRIRWTATKNNGLYFKNLAARVPQTAF